MRNGKTQLAAIVLAVIIAFVCGAGGGVAGMYLVSTGRLSLPGLVAADTAEQSSQPVLIEGPTAEAISKQTSGAESGTAVTSSSDSQIVYNMNSLTVAETIAEKVLPSVVGISTVSQQTISGSSYFGWGFGYGGGGGYTYDATSVGTGVIVDSRGYILTNSHVVGDGTAKSITVSLFDGSDVEGTVLWNDATLDLAVVKIDGEGLDLKAAELGDSDELKIGSYAAAIGNPLGLDFERSMSQGIISGLNRTIAVSNSNGSSTTMEGLLQTDATINSGNSGGPLLNSRGQVVGINSAKASSGEGMGFSIPINITKPIVESIIATGSFERPYIGISGQALEEQSRYTSAQLIDYFGTDKGIYVGSVAKGGGAEAAGLKEGDVITKLNGQEVNTMNKLNSIIIKYKAGDTVELTVMRDKEEKTFKVELKSSYE
ncbi:MAG: trypsin-like peptidase domain-containing protein [Firmicutes bacterium]|nr:trypsin-like peptidase domain-containing protein [Bacillota bacterium]